MSDCKLRAKNCGGCPLLGLDYAAQLKQKESAVRALLGKYGPVHPIRGMDVPYHYRNKVISTFAPAAGGKLTSGIYAARTHKVLPVESCLLEDEVLDKVLLAVRAAANRCRYQPYNEDRGTGLLRHCLLRRGVATGQVMVVLVTAQPVLPGAKNFVRYLLEEAETRGVPVTTVVQNYNPRQTSVVLGEAEKVLYGKGFILDTLCGKTYALSPRSFYQVNPVQTAVLYGLAVDAARLTGKETVLDAYCGVGTIGLAAAIIQKLTPLTLIPGMNPISEGVAIVGDIAVVLAGAFPLVYVITRVFKTPLMKLGHVLGMNDIAAAGLVATLANNIPMFQMLHDMDRRGKIINVAFAVSAAFVFGDHLGFTAGFDSTMIFPMIVGKLVGGVTAVAVAMLITRKYKEERHG